MVQTSAKEALAQTSPEASAEGALEDAMAATAEQGEAAAEDALAPGEAERILAVVEAEARIMLGPSNPLALWDF